MATPLTAPKQLFQTSLTESSSKDLETVGTLRWDGENCYRWVYNGSGGDLSAGEVVFHKDGDEDEFFQKVYKGATGDLSFMAGVVKSTTIADGEYGWIQVLGYCAEINMFASGLTAGMAIAVGDSLIGSNGKTYAIHGAASGTAPLHHRHIIALESLATSSTTTTAKKGIILCLS